MSEIALTFDLGAGALCLDLINTLEGRATSAPREYLTGYDALLQFAVQVEALDSERSAALRAGALRDAAAAEALATRARTFREGLYRTLDAVMLERAVDEDDLRVVNDEVRVALAHAQLEPGSKHFHWSVGADEPDLAEPLWAIARSAFELLLSPDVDRVRECANHECGWLFLDLSRNRSRKWCDMTTCGNRAKVRRFREREARP